MKLHYLLPILAFVLIVSCGKSEQKQSVEVIEVGDVVASLLNPLLNQ